MQTYDQLDKEEKMAVIVAFGNNVRNINTFSIIDSEETAEFIMGDNDEKLYNHCKLVGITKGNGLYLSTVREDTQKRVALLKKAGYSELLKKAGYSDLNKFKMDKSDNELINLHKQCTNVRLYHITDIKFTKNKNNVDCINLKVEGDNTIFFESDFNNEVIIILFNKIFKKNFDIYKTIVNVM